MDSEQKIEERKKWNAPFLRAFNYLLDDLSVNKGTLCSMVGIDPGLISKYANGTKKVSVDTMNALARVSSKSENGMINVDFMLGKSDFMLVKNIPDEDFLYDGDSMVEYVPIQDLRKMMGHKDIKQTLRYAKVKPDSIYEDFRRVENIKHKKKTEG